MIDRCLACGGSINGVGMSPIMGPLLHYHVGGPFATIIDARTVACRSCNANNMVTSCNASPDQHCAWAMPHEQMTEGRDFVYGDPKAAVKLNGIKPVMAWWLWTPMLESEEVGDAMNQAILSDEQLRRKDFLHVAVLDYDHIAVGAVRLLNRFDASVLLKSHVVRRPEGPYPSLRAERSIQTTFGGSRLMGVKHFWPAASLAPELYVPIADDRTLTGWWGEYGRQFAVKQGRRSSRRAA